jgi:predicted nucleic acid-binding Zn ribbon protein
MTRDPTPLGSSIERVVRSLRPGTSAASLGGVFGRWEEVVGPQVAEHARPSSLDSGRLVVVVDQPGWATQLRFLEADLLRRLAEMVGPGVVASIEVKVRRPSVG